jgi:pimeloyl-ACP methyl ester carboxylesterase
MRGATPTSSAGVARPVPHPRESQDDGRGVRVRASRLSLENGVAARIKCPLLVLFGAGDRIVPPSEGEKLAKAAGGPVDFVVYDEGNHVCFNIPYKFRPLTADWMAERLG